MTIKNAIALLLCCLFAVPVQADCHAFFVAPVKAVAVKHHAVQKVVAVQAVDYLDPYYQVGYQLRSQARDEYIRREAFQAGIEYQQTQQKLYRSQAAAAAVQPQREAVKIEPSSLLVSKCASCHGGESPKAGKAFDGGKLDCVDITAALREIAAGRMPKGSTLTAAEKGQIMQELLDLEK